MTYAARASPCTCVHPLRNRKYALSLCGLNRITLNFRVRTEHPVIDRQSKVNTLSEPTQSRGGYIYLHDKAKRENLKHTTHCTRMRQHRTLLLVLVYYVVLVLVIVIDRLHDHIIIYNMALRLAWHWEAASERNFKFEPVPAGYMQHRTLI
jgi:hypothetical protein